MRISFRARTGITRAINFFPVRVQEDNRKILLRYFTIVLPEPPREDGAFSGSRAFCPISLGPPGTIDRSDRLIRSRAIFDGEGRKWREGSLILAYPRCVSHELIWLAGPNLRLAGPAGSN